MPRGDRTGPNGMGQITGRGMGYCNGFEPLPNTGFNRRGLRLGRRNGSWF